MVHCGVVISYWVHALRQQPPGRGPLPVCEEFATGSCRTVVTATKRKSRSSLKIRSTLQVSLTAVIATGGSILSRQNKPRSLTELVSWWLCRQQTIVILLRASPQNNARLQQVRSAKKLPIPDLRHTSHVVYSPVCKIAKS